MCPTRWTVRGDSLESVLRNYAVLQGLWEEAREIVTDKSGQVSADQTCTSAFGINSTHRVVDIKSSKPGFPRKAHHHCTDIIPILKKVNVTSGFCTIYSHFSSLYGHNSFTTTSILSIAGQCIFICQCHQPNLYNETRACCPRMESSNNFSSSVYMYRSKR